MLRILPEPCTILGAMSLPPPSADALAHSAQLYSHLQREIDAAGGWISFARYMELALYAPGLGYYTAGSRKLGKAGDFITAPELTPLFGHTLARQLQRLANEGLHQILEIGAGSGALAAAILEELDRLDALPEHYLILELSPELRARERDTLAARVPHLLERVAWLNQLPPSFSGIVIGNEVLDAMPVEIVRNHGGRIEQAGVRIGPDDGRLQWDFHPADGELLAAAQALALPPAYTTEVGMVARAFIATLAQTLERGVLLFIDYGFPQHEYYHPQRAQGTLMCHYRHHAHDDPFYLPGLQDITAHVDFSAIALAACQQGLALAGYTTQAQFLINCGITELMLQTSPEDTARYLPLAAAANQLLSPAEMGELFKAIALVRAVNPTLLGFRSGERSATL
jgi:SAM-dependent MidA family methyltransferase